MLKYIENENYGNISIDTGIQFSKAVFETILIKNKPILLKEHIERLNIAIKKLDIQNTIDIVEVEKIIISNNLKFCALKILVSDKNKIATTRAIPYTDIDYKNGFKLGLSNVIKNSTSILSYIKSTAYIENIIEKNKIIKLGFNEVLFLNESGYIAECSMSNIFFIKNKKIYTPCIDSGILNGIIRAWIIKNFKVVEGHYTLDDLYNADAAFLTNSLMGIMSVKEFNQKKFTDKNIVNKIKDSYFELLEEL